MVFDLPHKPSRYAWPALAAVVAGTVCHAYSRVELLDDAYISFRYVENLVSGHGLVFNVGERVEGYTNFLWVMILALADVLGVEPGFASRLLGGFFAVSTVLAVSFFTPDDPERPAWSTALAPMMLALNGAVAMWAMHGLETAMFGFFLTLAMRAEIRSLVSGDKAWVAALFFALSALTRPEGILLFAASVAFSAVWYKKLWLSRLSWSPWIVFGAIVGAHWIWRLSYYGHPLPNTFYAKIGLTWSVVERGAEYVGAFFHHPGALLCAVALVPLARVRSNPRMAYCAWMLGAYLAMVMATGGDLFPGYRFLVPICPLLYYLVQEGMWILVQPAGGISAATRRSVGAARRVANAAVWIGLLAAYVQHAMTMRHEAHREVIGADEFTTNMRAVGLALRQHVPPSTRIALNAAGAVPYFSGLYAYDMLGLVNEHIGHADVPNLGRGRVGHEKGDGSYILDQKPDIILFGNVTIVGHAATRPEDARWALRGPSEREMSQDPRLTGEYFPASLPLGDGRFVQFLRRREFVLRPNDRSSSP